MPTSKTEIWSKSSGYDHSMSFHDTITDTVTIILGFSLPKGRSCVIHRRHNGST